jgi:hypothetical protein
VQPRELVEHAIERIERLDPQLNVMVHRQYDRALTDATSALPEGPFRGVPFLFKDYRCREAGEPCRRADPPRAHQHTRAGFGRNVRARRVRPHTQPVGPGAHAGRIVGWVGRRGGGTAGAVSPCQ